jgi:Rne/Rng family ribonuclease
MQKELIISTTSQETKIAILEDDELVEFYIERHRSQGIVGNIYKGKVTKVLPGMQSAFVDIGLERDAFLYVSDFFEDTEEYDKIVSTVEDEVAQLQEGGPRKPPLPAPLPASLSMHPKRRAPHRRRRPRRTIMIAAAALADVATGIGDGGRNRRSLHSKLRPTSRLVPTIGHMAASKCFPANRWRNTHAGPRTSRNKAGRK